MTVKGMPPDLSSGITMTPWEAAKKFGPYTSHTFECWAEMTKQMIAATTPQQRAFGIKPERGWWLNWPCICGLRELLGEHEGLIGEADLDAR